MSYFTDALSNFTTEAAYKESIRRLYDKGFSVDEIMDKCLYPVSKETIENVLSEYKLKKELPKTEYIEEFDKYGRKTFRKINK